MELPHELIGDASLDYAFDIQDEIYGDEGNAGDCNDEGDDAFGHGQLLLLEILAAVAISVLMC